MQLNSPSRSSNLTPVDFYLWRTLKYVMHHRKPSTLAKLKQEIENVCVVIPLDILANVVQIVVRRTVETNDLNFVKLL